MDRHRLQSLPAHPSRRCFDWTDHIGLAPTRFVPPASSSPSMCRAFLVSRSPCVARSLALLVALVGVAIATPRCASAGCTVRASDEILEVNVRAACCSTRVECLAERIVVREYLGSDPCRGACWQPTDLSRLTQPSHEGMATVFYIHGNQVGAADARRRSLDLYRTLVKASCDNRPIRYVLFSWPADEERGVLKDFRVKAARTRPAGWELAWVLSQLPPDTQVGLIGYSYGARIVGGAAHLMAGGSLSGLTLCDGSAAQRPPMRVAFIAAATHAHWFGPSRYHGLAMNQIDQLMLLVNEKDPAMRFYKWVEKNSSPQAMGLKGPCCLSDEQRNRVSCYNCTVCVGRSHDLYEYMAPRGIMRRMWRHVTFAQ